ncbi:MAG: hypothetical protein ACX939_11435, partial [Hyphococcus sp.]
FKTCRVVLLIIAGACLPANAQEHNGEAPTIRDLDFLIGVWEIENKVYYHYEPDRLLFVEKGRQECRYDLLLDEEPQYITCEGQWRVDQDDRQRYRETRTSISYNRFMGAFEQIGVYSNWPSHGANRVTFDSETRVMFLEGELEVQDNVIERLQDKRTYNEDLTAYDVVNVANFSNLPITQFNRVYEGKGRKVE